MLLVRISILISVVVDLIEKHWILEDLDGGVWDISLVKIEKLVHYLKGINISATQSNLHLITIHKGYPGCHPCQHLFQKHHVYMCTYRYTNTDVGHLPPSLFTLFYETGSLTGC